MSRTVQRIIEGVIVLVAWLVVQSPSIAQACSVCTAGRDEENQEAFLISTVGMSLMPLIALGTLLFVIRRRYQKLEAEMQPAAEILTEV